MQITQEGDRNGDVEREKQRSSKPQLILLRVTVGRTGPDYIGFPNCISREQYWKL